MTEWINIDERSPPQDVYVLIVETYHKDGFQHVSIAARLGNDWIDQEDGEVIHLKKSYVSHWMPIPDTPNPNMESESLDHKLDRITAQLERIEERIVDMDFSIRKLWEKND